ncbi:MAG: TetR/AcrR family transcriptional regulator [Solirubrobacteraceae bacterium]
MAEVVAERGLRLATISVMTERASVSHATFKRLFGDFDQCFAVLVGQIATRLTDLICEAFEREKAWRDGVLAGLEALLLFLDSEPALARVGLIEAVAGPAAVIKHQARLIERLGLLIDTGRDALPIDCQPPQLMAEAAIASVVGILRVRLRSDQAPPFIGLLGELAAVVVTPYLGSTEAVEAARAGAKRAQLVAQEYMVTLADFLVPLPSQLARANAHRLRACLLYIAENPGASNKYVAGGIGVSHLGQVSVLLARLEGVGVLRKQAGRAGHPNAWTLSSYGEQVARTLTRR